MARVYLGAEEGGREGRVVGEGRCRMECGIEKSRGASPAGAVGRRGGNVPPGGGLSCEAHRGGLGAEIAWYE